LIAGGNEGVGAILRDAERAGYTNVFGVIDRDFGSSDKVSWSEKSKTFRSFVLPVHEIENYLLHAEALADSRSNNMKKTSSEIAAILDREAKRRVWWAACGAVWAELRGRFRDGFIRKPSCPPVESEAEARRHICEDPWFAALAGKVAQTNEAEIDQMLTQAYVTASAQMDDGTWKDNFSGKEILHYIESRICDQTKLSRQPTPSEFDSDLAKEVGEWQIDHKVVPPDLTDLLAALKQRIATAGSSS
jgi:hypothetical protein